MLPQSDSPARSAVDSGGIALLTFDCYGTLIDWLSGILGVLRRLPSLRGCDLERLVRDRDAIDREQVLGPYAPYGVELAASLREAAARQGRAISEREQDAFVASMASWPPFAESSDCLRRLATRYRLAILSNVETRVLDASRAQLAAPFEFCVTAEQVRSYKPARAHFDEALRRGRIERERVLHVACSSFHDVAPALALGWRVAWINRENEPAPAGRQPDLVVPDLSELCRALRV